MGGWPPPRTPSPVNRHRPRCGVPPPPLSTLYFECVGQPFDAIEATLTKDWAGWRTELRRSGITPTASYTTQLMGNPSGGQSQGLTYSGTLQTAINWDLDTLPRLPGLLFNVGAAWLTGKNLSADDIGNSFTVQSAYTAPGDGTQNPTLGEMYVQQQLLHNSLLIAAGRLVPETTFATMPVLNQYVNAGINAHPQGLSASTTRRLRLIPRFGMGRASDLQPYPEVADGSRGV